MNIPAIAKLSARTAVTRCFIASLGLAGLVRLGFVAWSGLPFESDEAIVGLMARHILYQGALPSFYYGQQYMGSLEAASAAIFFAILGPSVFTLRLAPLAWSLTFVAFTAAFARRAFGRPAFGATLMYLAVPPLFLLTWSVKARGGYPELLALGAILLWQVDHLARDRCPRAGCWIAFGAVAGLALWTDPLVVVYLGPAALYLALHLRQRLADWRSPAAVGAAILTSLPLLLANLHDPGVTYRQLAGPAVRDPITIDQLSHNLGEAIRVSFPIVAGIFQGCSTAAAFFASRAASGIPLRLVHAGAVLGALLIGFLLLQSIERAIRRRPEPADLLVWVFGFTMVPFILTQQQAEYLTEPRYLVPLYAAVPLAAAYWSQLWQRWRVLALTLLTLALAINLSGYLRFQPDLAGPYLAGQAIHTADPSLTALLLQRGIRATYADYWLSYPLAFQSGERIATAIIEPDLRVGFNRYIPYAIIADAEPAPAVLVLTDGVADRSLRAWLGQQNATFQTRRWENVTIYEQITPPFRPIKG